jgi:hypothetical protein
MKITFRIIGSVLIVLIANTISNAQAIKPFDPALIDMPVRTANIDGNLKNWGDSLRFINLENNLHYDFAIDKDELYFAIRIDDRVEAIKILKAGLTLGLDPKGKKKAAFAITFPLSNTANPISQKPLPDNFNEVTQADRDELAREMMTSLRGIKVEGFKDVEGDMITTSNSYGIKTFVGYDEKGNLLCEAGIALKLLHVDEHAKGSWLYDIKINGIVRQMPKPDGDKDGGPAGGGMGGRGGMGGGGGMGGMGGMGGGGMGRGGRGGRGGGDKSQQPTSDNSPLSKSIEFGGKLVVGK